MGSKALCASSDALQHGWGTLSKDRGGQQLSKDDHVVFDYILTFP
jgi:hypothetical protein